MQHIAGVRFCPTSPPLVVQTQPGSSSGLHSALRWYRARIPGLQEVEDKGSLHACMLLQPDRALYKPGSSTLALTTLFQSAGG